MTKGTLRSWMEHGLTTAVISAAVGGGISYWVSTQTFQPAQDRELRLTAASSFSASADEFLSLGTQIVPKLNRALELDDVKIAIANASGKQAINAQSLIDLFGPSINDEARGYQLAVTQFVTVTDGLDSPEQVKEWVVAFDGVVIAQRDLKASMNLALDIKPMGGSLSSHPA